MLTYLNDRTIAVMMPVTNTTIPSMQKKPAHLVKSTYRRAEKHVNTHSDTMP